MNKNRDSKLRIHKQWCHRDNKILESFKIINIDYMLSQYIMLLLVYFIFIFPFYVNLIFFCFDICLTKSNWYYVKVIIYVTPIRKKKKNLNENDLKISIITHSK